MRRLKWWHVIAVFGAGLGILMVSLIIFAPDFIRFCALVDYLDTEDRLTVHITTPLPESYEVEVWYGDDEYTQFRCENGGLVGENIPAEEQAHDFGADFTEICDDQIMTSGKLVKEFTVKIIWRDGSYETTVRPDYQTYEPNGEGCEPKYRRAQVELEISN